MSTDPNVSVAAGSLNAHDCLAVTVNQIDLGYLHACDSARFDIVLDHEGLGNLYDIRKPDERIESTSLSWHAWDR